MLHFPECLLVGAYEISMWSIQFVVVEVLLSEWSWMKSAACSVQLNRFQVQIRSVLLQKLLVPLYALWTEINDMSIQTYLGWFVWPLSHVAGFIQ